MSRRRKIILGIIAGFVFILLGFFLLFPGQPRHDGKTVAQWFEVAVNSTNVDDRLHAINKLTERRTHSVPYLLQRLQSKDSKSQEYYRDFWRGTPGWLRDRLPEPQSSYPAKVMAVYVLRQIGPDAASAVPELLVILSLPLTNAPLVQMPSRTPFEPALPPSPVPFVASAAGTDRAKAAAAGTNAPVRLMPSRLNLKTAAIHALAAIGSDDPQVIAVMLAQTGQRDLALQLETSALIISPRLHPALARAEPMLLSAFKSSDALTRQTVLRACSIAISNSVALEEVVLAGASDPDWRLRSTALPLLGAIRKHPQAAMNAMVEALGSRAGASFSPAIGAPLTLPRNPLVPVQPQFEYPDPVVMGLLTRSMPQDDFYFQALLRGLEHTNALVRTGCLMAFRQSGEAAQPFAIQIEKRLLDDSRTVRQVAASTMWQLAAWRGSMMTFMMSKLSDTNEFHRLAGVVFLESNPPKQTEAEGRRLLQERLRLDASSQIRARSATALAAMGGNDLKTIEALGIAGRDDEDLSVRNAAADALAKLQTAPPARVP